MTDFQDRLRNAFPVESFPNTIRGLREGIAAADEAVKGIPIFDTPVGRDLRGLIRRAGVMYRIHEMCKIGDLPFSAVMTPMPKGSWHWLEIADPYVVAHIVKTDDADAFPLDTPNRQDQRCRNQLNLFDDPKIVSLTATPRLYVWLCYGATKNGALTHACWNAPASEGESWLAKINLLNVVPLRGQHQADDPVQGVDPRAVMTLKETANEAVRFIKPENKKS